MEENKRPQPGKPQRPVRYYWLVPPLLAALALLAVLALQIGGRRQPTAGQPTLQTPATPTAARAAVSPTQPAPTAAPTAALPTVAVQPSPAAPGALASIDDVQRIDPAEAKALVDQGKAVIYDVRSQESFASSHAAGAILLPYDQIEAQASTLPKDKILILYCT